MSTADEHNKHDAILALLDGDLSPDEAASLRAELEADSDSSRELAAWTAMFDDLHGIGDAVTAGVPDVSLWDNVSKRLDADFAHDADEPWTFDRLLDLAEGRIDPRAATALREQIDQSDELKQAYAWVTAIREELGEHGDRLVRAVPSIDLLPAIMSAVTHADAEPEELYAALLEWRDGRLPLPEADRLRRLAEHSDSAQSANEWLAATTNDLESLGDEIAANAPSIDVTEAVMDAVHRITEPETIVTLDAERLRRRSFRRKAAGFAAAAAIALGIGWVWFTAERETLDNTPIVDTPQLTTPTPTREELQQNIMQKREALPTRVSRRKIAGNIERPVELQITRPPELDALDADAVLEARKKAMRTGDWTEFQQLAALTREEAIELAKKEGIPATALVGLAESLLPDEKEEQLLTVVGVLPDSPYVQLQLLESVVAQPPGEAQSEQPLAFSQRISELDPDNALPYYLEAKMYLDAGNPEAAIAVLLEARGLEFASTYSLEAAAHRQSALIADGMSPDAARMLAAFNAGSEEADALFNLAVDLLEYGDYYQEIEDFATAQAIYEGVQQFGAQVEEGAVLSQEQLAALDIQSVAIDALAGIYEIQGLVEAFEPLTQQSIDLLADLEGMNALFGTLNTMLEDILDPAVWNDVIGIFLTEGDLVIFDYLDDWGIVPESP